MPRGLTGAKPTPRDQYMALPRFVGRRAAPISVAYIPAKLSMWGNDNYGDCVTAEEAFKCACEVPEVFIQDETVISWARSHRVLNGATLTEVLDFMQEDGFKQNGQGYNDGPYGTVDYADPTALRLAIATGPVKIGMASSALPAAAGDRQGWFALGGAKHRNLDHCVALCGYGTAGELYRVLGVPLPAEVPDTLTGFLLYTWSTIGFVTHAWILSCTGEAYVRHPSTVFDPPLPVPPIPPIPPIPPTPGPTPPRWLDIIITLLPYVIQLLNLLLPLLAKLSERLTAELDRKDTK